MVVHRVQVYPSKTPLPKTEQLAWKMAEVVNTAPAADVEVAEMVINRMIDNAGVALAAINRPPVANADRKSVV